MADKFTFIKADRKTWLAILDQWRESAKHMKGKPFVDDLRYRIEANLLMLAACPDDDRMRRRLADRLDDWCRVMGIKL
jgi:hypothetical protein